MTTLDKEEVEKFSKIADQWWDPSGDFKPLHKFNPIRLQYIRQKITENFNLDAKAKNPFNKLQILDVGCGGGLVSEPISRLGAQVTAIDASEKNIKTAMAHLEKSQLKIDYQQNLIEDFVANANNQQKFDVVLALEIIEHVNNPEKFVNNCAKALKKDGLLFVATLNRTIKSLLTAKIGAEYILRWLPIGTHQFNKFLKPSEINNFTNNSNLNLQEIMGFNYNIFKDQWQMNKKDIDVNFMMVFKNAE